jgi:uncharacterized protein (TIGR00106 family)
VVIAEVSVLPVGTSSPSVSQYVAKAVKVLDQLKGVNYQVTATGTIITGKLDDVLRAVKKMHDSLFNDKVKRVVTILRLDDRRDKELTIGYEVDSVMKRLS